MSQLIDLSDMPKLETMQSIPIPILKSLSFSAVTSTYNNNIGRSLPDTLSLLNTINGIIQPCECCAKVKRTFNYDARTIQFLTFLLTYKERVTVVIKQFPSDRERVKFLQYMSEETSSTRWGLGFMVIRHTKQNLWLMNGCKLVVLLNNETLSSEYDIVHSKLIINEMSLRCECLKSCIARFVIAIINEEVGIKDLAMLIYDYLLFEHRGRLYFNPPFVQDIVSSDVQEQRRQQTLIDNATQPTRGFITQLFEY